MKAKLAFVTFLVAVVALVGVGCKATGGGWFIDEWSGHKITFGFNARPVGDEGDAEGELELVDHDSKTTMHGTFNGTDGGVFFWGTCSVNGTGDYDFDLYCVDGGEPGIGKDYIEVRITGISITGYPICYGYLGGGNIQLHEAKEK